MKDFTFRYGDDVVTLSLPEEQILAVLRGHDTPPIPDIPAALSEALSNPINKPALSEWIRPGESVCLVVSDLSRFWMRQDLVIPHLVNTLNACGVPDEKITILVANGTHLGGDEKEFRMLVTDSVFERVRVVNHDCRARDSVFLGTTSFGTRVLINRIAAEADRVITLGACTHHVMAGYGGGRKSILPGIAALSTIRQNHAFALDPQFFRSSGRIGNGVTAGNPLHLDMCEAAGFLPRLFTVNLVMNADMRLSHIFAGDYMRAWETGCRAVDDIYRAPIQERADIVIASCGGFPKDMSLYQGTKTIDNVEGALKPGGTLILLIEARDGGGPAEYFDWIGPLTDGSFAEKLRAGFTVPGYIFLLNCEQAERYRILMLTSVPRETLAPMGIKAFSDPYSLLAAADLSGKSIYVIPNGSTVVPRVEGE
ncbi:MAG: nickel-dependent lactate racemase [Clostridiales bacterium]|nr:nickel-dependent lactate racemase [Clostridiales bacterium]